MKRYKNFAGISDAYSDPKDSKIILQSFPYDGTSTWGKGANKGFEAFMDAAENMELYDIETDTEVYKQGIYVHDEISEFNSPEDMFNKTYARTKEILNRNQFPTFFGGEHSVSIGIIKAFYEKYEDLTVLQIDAHADLRSEYNGTPYNHACAMYDASQNCNLIQVGIRSMDISEKALLDYYKVYFADEIKYSTEWFEESIKQMSDKVYISFDLDAFDPSIMPATGTPEPGGLHWYLVTSYLARVFEEKDVVGFDIVELAPIEGLHAPQFLAAKLYYKMLSYKFS